MKKGTLVFLILLGCALIFGAITFGMYVSATNKNVELKQLINAQRTATLANFDKMFKTIDQLVNVAEAKKDAAKELFKDVYPDLMEGRYGKEKDGILMKWVQESNPQMDLKAALNIYDFVAEPGLEKPWYNNRY